MGKCCVVGCDEMQIDYGQRLFETPAGTVSRDDWITVDGNTGRVLLGRIDTIEPGGETTCSDGTPYKFFVRPGAPEKVVFYLQGGGGCWNGGTC